MQVDDFATPLYLSKVKLGSPQKRKFDRLSRRVQVE